MTKEKTKLALFAVLVILVGMLVLNMQSLKTCDICGYQTLTSTGEKCPVCSIALHDDYLEQEGYASFDEMLLEEQTLFFSAVDNMTLESPQTCVVNTVSYKKDPNWKPSTSKEAIDSYKNMLDDLINKIE